jgi:hypothetical protein
MMEFKDKDLVALAASCNADIRFIEKGWEESPENIREVTGRDEYKQALAELRNEVAAIYRVRETERARKVTPATSTPFYEKVISVDPSDSVQFEAFLDEHHWAYHYIKQWNPELSHKGILQILDAPSKDRGIHWPDIFAINQLTLKRIIDHLNRSQDPALGMLELNGAMKNWNIHPQLELDECGRPWRTFSYLDVTDIEGLYSGIHIFRRCLIELYWAVETTEKITGRHKKIYEPLRSEVKQSLQYKPTKEVQRQLKEEYGIEIGIRQLQKLKNE